MSEGDGTSRLGLLSKRLSQVLDTLRRRASTVWAEVGEGRLLSLLPLRLQELLARRGWGPPTRVLGLDVDGGQVFAVELARRRNTVVVERAAQFPLPASAQPADAPAGARQPDAGAREAGAHEAGTRREAAELDAGQGAAVVQELTRRGFHARQMATVVSRERTFERTFQLPPGSQAELEAMAALRSEHELPLAAEEACVDFLFVGNSEERREGTAWPPAAQGGDGHLVVVCAASKAVVDKQTAPWVEAGLEPLALEVVGQSAFRALRLLREPPKGLVGDGGGAGGGWSPAAAGAAGDDDVRHVSWSSEAAGPSRPESVSRRTEAGTSPVGRPAGQGGLVCLLLVREWVTELVIGRETPQFSRSLLPGGFAWSAEGRSGPAAEEARPVERPEARLAREVTRTLQAFATEFPDEAVERVVLVSRFAVNGEVLERAVGLPVEAPAGLPGTALVDTGPVGELGATFAPAVGAAWPEVAWRPGVPMRMERANLLTRRQVRWERERRYRRVRIVALAVVLALVGMFLPASLAGVRLLNLALLLRRLEALGPQVKELETMERRLELLRPWTGERVLPLELLAELTRVATAEVYVKSVTVSEAGRLDLKGVATGHEGAYALVRGLGEKSALLSSVSLVGGSRGGTAQGGSDPRFTYEFTVTAQLPRWVALGPGRAAVSPPKATRVGAGTEEPQ